MFITPFVTESGPIRSLQGSLCSLFSNFAAFLAVFGLICQRECPSTQMTSVATFQNSCFRFLAAVSRATFQNSCFGFLVGVSSFADSFTTFWNSCFGFLAALWIRPFSLRRAVVAMDWISWAHFSGVNSDSKIILFFSLLIWHRLCFSWVWPGQLPVKSLLFFDGRGVQPFLRRFGVSPRNCGNEKLFHTQQFSDTVLSHRYCSSCVLRRVIMIIMS